MDTTKLMFISALARSAQVGVDTIRYYEQLGLIAPARRRASGYRVYDHLALERLQFIGRAKALGFSLANIGELLALSADRDHGVSGVKQRAQARLAEVDAHLEQLQRMRDGLERLIESCPGHGPLGHCPILAALSGTVTDPEGSA